MNTTPATHPATGTAPAPVTGHRLEHLPVSIFSIVMGTAGLAIAWGKAAGFGAPWLVGASLRWWALMIFAACTLAYAAKLLRHPRAVAGEIAHPVRLNFFPAMSISLMLLAVTFVRGHGALATVLWTAGAGLHLGFTVYVMSSWMHHEHYKIQHANPAWFIPIVGNVVAPVAGVAIAPAELSWFFFAIGMVFWLVLFTIVMNRLMFFEPLPARLTPTLFILIAPPAVGFLAWLRLTDTLDAFARVLYYAALFLTLLLASNALRFFRLPFFLSSWAYSFPLAAITIATLAMAERTGHPGFVTLGWGLLTVLSAVLIALTARTLLAIRRGEICVPE